MDAQRDEGREEKTEFSGFTAPPAAPGQAIGRSSKAALDEWLSELKEQPTWRSLYDELLAERVPVMGPDGQQRKTKRGKPRFKPRWDWRKALFIAWYCVPKEKREPRTQEELAKLLGLTNTRTIRVWRQKDPEIDERIAAIPKQKLMEHVADVMDAMVVVAKMPVPAAHQDRKLFFEMTGQHDPKGTIDIQGGGVLVVLPDNGREDSD